MTRAWNVQDETAGEKPSNVREMIGKMDYHEMIDNRV